jgi:hypothetical protein
MSERLDPKKIFTITDESGNSIDFWALQNDDCSKVHIGVSCTQSMAQDDVLEALQFFIDKVVDEGVSFLETDRMVKH